MVSLKRVIVILSIFTCLLLLLDSFALLASERSVSNKLGMTFIYVPAGEFLMGSPKNEIGRDWNEDIHTVVISKGFYIQESEVTQGQWKKLVGFNPSSFPDCGESCPVDTVSWDQCIEFIRVLNEWEGTTKYRLPTEAEWEYACRANSRTAFANGDITQELCLPIEPALDEIAWYCGNSGYKGSPDNLGPRPVKTKKPNSWGIYDMQGNVQEWCMDSCGWKAGWFGRTGVVTSTYKNNIVDPISKDGDHRVLRGGGWHLPSRHCRSAKRSFYKPMAKRNSLGFRIVREL
ncbi:MAG: formylglycine-generating enzyme family protein [Desulfamplus sp.]|nr:formylglycine-generating enzyme family protein [Desulfamplus sp.]MBF0389676.1 formylglycine-generating enzyme family protein [Desulfamplus sp.]